jgi:GTP cyclohydrolase I
VSRRVTWDEVYERLSSAPPGRLYGIPRGGAIVAGLTGRAVDRPEDADWMVEDVIDSGATLAQIASTKPAWGLFDRRRDGVRDQQLIFPWDRPPDASQPRRAQLERLGGELLEMLGYDVSSEALRDTPARWARWWEEFHEIDMAAVDTTFQSVSVGQLVVVSGIEVWSMCEHHLLPFNAEVAIGYLASDRLLGLSKFARVAQRAAKRLQLQERMAKEVADQVVHLTGSPDVAVLVRGRHLCMEARGARTAAVVASLVQSGAFETDPALSARFMSLTHATTRVGGRDRLA